MRDVFEDAYNYMKSGQLMRQVINKINAVDFNNLAERQHFGDIYEQILNDLQSAGNAGEYYTPRAVTAFMADRIDPQPGEILFDPACGTGGFLTCAIRHMRERYVKTPADEQKMQKALRATEKKQLPHMLCVTNMLLHGIDDPSFVRHDNTLARPYISYTQSDRVDIVLTNPALRRPRGRRHREQLPQALPDPRDGRPLPRPHRAPAQVRGPRRRGPARRHPLRRRRQDPPQGAPAGGVQPPHHRPPAQQRLQALRLHRHEPARSSRRARRRKEIWFYEHRVPEGQKAYSMTKPIRFEHLKPCIDWWDKREENEVAWKVTIDEIKARSYNLDFKNPHTVEEDHGDPAELLAKLEESEAETAKLRDQAEGHSGGGAAAMSPDRLLEYFDQISEAPDAVPRLRRFILDLAVRGKLVEQDPKDEPAGELLKRIEAERDRLVAEGTIKEIHALPEAAADDTPFDLPKSWEWERFGKIVGYSIQSVRPHDYPKHPHIAPDNIESRTEGSCL